MSGHNTRRSISTKSQTTSLKWDRFTNLDYMEWKKPMPLKAAVLALS